MATEFKAGQRVQIVTYTFDGDGSAPGRSGKIARKTASMHLPSGYLPVRFDDGGLLLVHADRILAA